jgi:uncharacterized LabA/DUF88 family protein
MKVNTTLLQIDFQNLSFEAKRLNQRLDYEKIIRHFNDRDSEFLVGANIYISKNENYDNSNFEALLKAIGYNVKIKSIPKMDRSRVQLGKISSQDMLIAIDCLDKIKTFNKWILMSGDSDFTDLCKYLRSKNKAIEIWSFKGCLSTSLRRLADEVFYIDNNFIYKKPLIKVFGFNLDEPKIT